ncbi:MAG: hypothetical protein WD737_14250 [Gemmatimonadota bacterium]
MSMAPGTVRGGDSSVLLREQILEAGQANAWEAINHLRPLWLNRRSIQSVQNRETDLVVYLDNVRFGSSESLLQIPADVIERVQMFDTTAASQRWGPGHSQGVIAVYTRSSD